MMESLALFGAAYFMSLFSLALYAFHRELNSPRYTKVWASSDAYMRSRD